MRSRGEMVVPRFNRAIYFRVLAVFCVLAWGKVAGFGQYVSTNQLTVPQATYEAPEVVGSVEANLPGTNENQIANHNGAGAADQSGSPMGSPVVAADLSQEYFAVANPKKFVGLLRQTSQLADYFKANLAVQSPELLEWIANLNDNSAKSIPKAAVGTGLIEIAGNDRLISDNPNISGEADRYPIYKNALNCDLKPDIQRLNELLILAFFGDSIKFGPKYSETGKHAEDRKKLISRIASNLDKVDRSAEEWGRATISDIAFIDNTITPDHAGYFALQYSNPTAFYMNQARNNVQGTASQSISEEFSGTVLAQYSPGMGSLPGVGKAIPTAVTGGATNAALTATNGTATATNAAPVSTNSPTTTATGGGTPLLTNFPPVTFLSSNPAVNITIQSNLQAQLSEGTVTKIGASDKETELILDFMTDPYKLPDNKRAYIGVMQVSMLPGWRTKKGYIGEVQVNFQYALTKEGAKKYCNAHFEELTEKQKKMWGDEWNKLPDSIYSDSNLAKDLGLPVGYTPSVLSAFPFAESQILDLTSSLQRQLSLLAQISASIPQIPGLATSLQSTFKKLTQQALSTRTSLPLVIPGSVGQDVTYRFDPELQALVEPWNSGSGPGQMLEPSSFPALVVIICDENELLTWDSVSVSSQTRWIPESRRHWFKLATYDWWYYSLWNKEAPFENGERLENARLFDQLDVDLGELESSYNGYAYQEANRRFDNLRTAAMGYTGDAPLPLVRPHVSGIYPHLLRQDFYPTNLVIQGRYFNSPFSPVTNVIVNGMVFPIGINDVDSEGHFIHLPISAEQWSRFTPGQYDIEICSSAGAVRWNGKERDGDGFTVLPVPSPVVNAVAGLPIREYLTSSDVTQTLKIQGSNFYVGDGSLAVALNNIPLTNPICLNNSSISIQVDPTTLHLAPGAYNLTVSTSGGQCVLTNAVSVIYQKSVEDDNQPPILPPVVTSVAPDSLRLDELPVKLHIFGDHFELRKGVQAIRIGGLSLVKNEFDHLDDKVITVTLPAGRWMATNYDMEVVNEAGGTVLTNAIQILPVAVPALTAIAPMPVKIAIASATNPVVPVSLTIYGQNMGVIYGKDDSRQISIGGILVTSTPVINDDGLSMSLTLGTNEMKSLTSPTTGLKAGTYNLGIITAGGSSVLTNVVQIGGGSASSATPRAPKITDYFPKHGFLYATTVFGVSGSNFLADNCLFEKNKMQVLIGGKPCTFSRLSDTELIVSVPPWASTSSTNDVAWYTNKLDLSIIDSLGTDMKSNAIAFDLTMPKDAGYQAPLTPQEEQIEKMMHAVFYADRVMGTNPVLETEINVATSAGSKVGKTSGAGNTTALPNIIASLIINSNPVTAVTPVVNTNTPAK